jgi:3-keto-5-aminohexanoate cleavage enzyme
VELSVATETNTAKTVQYLQDHNIKPEFMNHNWEGIMNVKQWLIKPGILKKPYLMSMGPGMHNAAESYPDPWGMLYVLGMIKMMPEDSIISLSAGGRNWLPISNFGILMGIDGVRVGMEDHVWMYPHKDEKIKRSADETKKIATIARELGRDVATPPEARKIMGFA